MTVSRAETTRGHRLPRPTLQDDLLDILGARITGGVYATNAVLRTEDLEAEFRLSRTVVREALKVLESMGLIAVRRRIGLMVRPEDAWHVFDPHVIRWRLAGTGRAAQLASLTELRQAIEPQAARGAAVHATSAQRAEFLRLATLLEETGSVGDLEAFLGYDIAYHRLLLHASGNEMFAALTDVVTEVLTGRTVHHLMPEHPKPEARMLHQRVAVAIDVGDGGSAEMAMRGILSEVSGQMEALLGLGGDGATAEAGAPHVE